MSRTLLPLSLLLLSALAGCKLPAVADVRPKPPLPSIAPAFQGSNIIATGGLNIIATGGLNLIATGGGNFSRQPAAPSGEAALASPDQAKAQSGPATRLVPDRASLALPASLLAARSGYALLAGNQAPSIAEALRNSLALYQQTAGLIDQILTQVRQHALEPDQVYPFTLRELGAMSVVVREHDGQGVIAIGLGDVPEGDQQIAGIRFDPETRRGSAVFYPPEGPGGLQALATTFDLAAGTASADALLDSRGLEGAQPQLARAHWVLTSQPDGARAFRIQIAATSLKEGDAAGSGSAGITADFLADGSAAAIFAVQLGATENRLRWVPNDGDFSRSAPPHDFYMAADGSDLQPAKAPEALKAIVPPDDALVSPFPAAPTSGAPKDDPLFQFPR